MLTLTCLIPLLLVASANGQDGTYWGSYSATYGGDQPQQSSAWQPRTFSLPKPVARPQPVAEAQVSFAAGGYQHDNTGDDGYGYVHDTRGDFGPYRAWLARNKQQQSPVQQAAPVQQARPVVQQSRPVIQKVRKLVQQARPAGQQARPVVQQAKQEVASVPAVAYDHDSTGDSGYAYVHDTRGDFGPYRNFLARQKQQNIAQPIVQQARPVVQQSRPVVQQFSGPVQAAAPAFQQSEVGPATHSPLRYVGHTNEFVDYVNRFGIRAYDYAAPTYSAQAEGNSYTYSASF